MKRKDVKRDYTARHIINESQSLFTRSTEIIFALWQVSWLVLLLFAFPY